MSLLGLLTRLATKPLAAAAAAVLALLYLSAVFAGFLGPNDPTAQTQYSYLPPTPVHFFLDGRPVRPYVYAMQKKRNPVTFALEYVPNLQARRPIYFFIHGYPYKILGLIRSDIHLFGSTGPLFIFGADSLGRGIFSRLLQGAQVSLSIGLVVVAITFPLGLLLGGASGYIGGRFDFIIQRLIEVLLSIPTLPLLLVLSMLIPAGILPIYSFLEIAAILAALGWTGLARIVRGQILAMREQDYVVASQALGASRMRTILRHMAPNIASYLVVTITLQIPGYILAESSLSFLGLGIHPPMTSWGLLLSAALASNSLSLHPWILIPGGFIALAILCFNFLGDGLRDLVDPYRRSL